MLPPNPDHLAERDYAGPASETAQQTRLAEAWRALRREPGMADLEQRIARGDLSEDDVIDVICAAALRVLRNPEGIEQESAAIDDYQESFKRADASSDMYFTAAELRRLAPAPVVRGGFSGSWRYC